ncbi:hypothetical protein CVIRNUC_000410 [Coccomyxa viridis]|uniref:Uncharacterized protein n=1 Tax=Coccomyxa viridis TaxID=1274662 RepID=A0AAV1HRC3_9CHLO|nr:hypothetical protein CVIRNUC_000410 [Coccomyxa viridis]
MLQAGCPSGGPPLTYFRAPHGIFHDTHLQGGPVKQRQQRWCTGRASQHLLHARRGIDDAEIAVFRFTLGIPGFDDALIPRVVGSLGAALLIANHLSDPAQATDAQVRTECLGAVLSALCIATPSIGARLRAAKPGRGRAAGAADEALGQVFQIAPELPDGVRTELAWASYSLLRNTNSSGMLVTDSTGGIKVVRGAVKQAQSSGAGIPTLLAMQKDLRDAAAAPGSVLQITMQSSAGPEYLADASALSRAGLKGALLPDSASSALVQPLASTSLRAHTAVDQAESSSAGSSDPAAASSNGREQDGGDESGREIEAAAGVLLMWSDRPRALSQRERIKIITRSETFDYVS